MITILVYDNIFLPNVVFYFKSDVLRDWNIEDRVEAGTEFAIGFLKEQAENGFDPENVFPVGIVARVEEKEEDGVKLRTLHRCNIANVVEMPDGVFDAEVTIREDEDDLTPQDKRRIFETLRNDFLRFAHNYQWGLWARPVVLQWKNLEEFACSIASYLDMEWPEKAEIVITDSVRDRYARIEKAVYEMIALTNASSEAEEAQQMQNESLYREDAVKKQIEILQRELDEMHPENVSDVRKFEMAIRESGMNDTARREAEKVLNRMKQEGKDGHEYGMLYDYLDFVTSLSWKCEEAPEIDLSYAESVLERDHYGLKKVKERIIQQLAVMALRKTQSGSILLFVGAPGTGKTSIGQSIAEALHREYVRISLGGIRDEAEIRGHRRTYIGAMPGRIMEGMKRCGSSNPVMVLDEVDKLMRDYGGDPASALLEVLDPEQNGTFTDHYMNVPYDLSRVLFVCTANTTDTIPEPLLNRMEVIEFQGYTATDKMEIAKKHLIPKAYENAGIKKSRLRIPDTTLKKLISEYTAESGVRGLKKAIDGICRYAAVQLVKDPESKLSVKPNDLKEWLGKRIIHHDVLEKTTVTGIVTGLAWTAAGGEILFIETSLVKGQGKVTITGQLGDVMKESVEIAISLVKAMYPKETAELAEKDLHVHVPEGAVPKDGPSAGITIVTALVSLITGRKVPPTTAMTGEVSLRGNVMPIGGLTEKLMAAQRAGVKRVFIPDQNKEDLEDVPAEVLEKLEIIPVRRVKDVLETIFSPAKA